nr:histone H2A-beta, sperm-like [Halyomorpha halys]
MESFENDISKKHKKNNKDRYCKVGLNFPVSRIHKNLKLGNYAERIRNGASVYLTSVLEYLVAELLHLAGEEVKKPKKMILPKHLLSSLMKDKELKSLLSGAIIMDPGIELPGGKEMEKC